MAKSLDQIALGRAIRAVRKLHKSTASLDAAMTLVPEGYGWRLWIPAAQQSADGDQARVTIWGPLRSYAPNDSVGATPALALTAASIRARARTSGDA